MDVYSVLKRGEDKLQRDTREHYEMMGIILYLDCQGGYTTYICQN